MNLRSKLFAVVFCLIISVSLLTGCGATQPVQNVAKDTTVIPETIPETVPETMPEAVEAYDGENIVVESADISGLYDNFDWTAIPDYAGEDMIIINGDVPLFDTAELAYNGTNISLSEHDSLGRCQVAMACVGQETEPTEKREDISHVYPSGWRQVQLSDGTYLYNRSHLLMFALTGLNDDDRNLITGSQHFNQESMLGLEETVKWVVDNRNAHVLYRVTPVYHGDDMVAYGVLMEAYCFEYPEDCTFCRFVYNVQPDVTIEYSTGVSTETPGITQNITKKNNQKNNQKNFFEENSENRTLFSDDISEESVEIGTYVLNTNSKKIHLPTCDSVSQMSEKNKQEYVGYIEVLEAQGYTRCNSCNP